MLFIKKTFESINRIFVYISIFTLLFAMFLTTADVLGRFFGRPIMGVYEIVEISLALVVFAALGNSQITKSHIGIDFFMVKLPIWWQNFFDTIGYFLSFSMFSVAFWQMLIYANRMYTVNLETGVLRIPIYPWVIISAFGVLLFTVILLGDLIKTAAKLLTREGYKL